MIVYIVECSSMENSPPKVFSDPRLAAAWLLIDDDDKIMRSIWDRNSELNTDGVTVDLNDSAVGDKLEFEREMKFSTEYWTIWKQNLNPGVE